MESISRVEYGYIKKRIGEINTELPTLVKEEKRLAAFGDISENAELQAVITKLGTVRKTLARLEEIITSKRVVNKERVNKIAIGDKLRIRIPEKGEGLTVYLFQYYTDIEIKQEGEMTLKTISMDSGLAKAIIGKKPGRIEFGGVIYVVEKIQE